MQVPSNYQLCFAVLVCASQILKTLFGNPHPRLRRCCVALSPLSGASAILIRIPPHFAGLRFLSKTPFSAPLLIPLFFHLPLFFALFL
ncbi:hypothetical protein B0H11DRAFT_2123687 [Mycena galericulata]|nr:hypothetical protein B0H11DRAFT_2123687 [Mycena galericulata]